MDGWIRDSKYVIYKRRAIIYNYIIYIIYYVIKKYCIIYYVYIRILYNINFSHTKRMWYKLEERNQQGKLVKMTNLSFRRFATLHTFRGIEKYSINSSYILTKRVKNSPYKDSKKNVIEF